MGPVQWIVYNVLSLYWWVILVDVILSWLVAFDVVNTRNKIVGTIADVTNRLTAPLLNPLRKIIPPVGGLDLSPLVLIFGMQFLQKFLVPYIPF